MSNTGMKRRHTLPKYLAVCSVQCALCSIQTVHGEGLKVLVLLRENVRGELLRKLLVDLLGIGVTMTVTVVTVTVGITKCF